MSYFIHEQVVLSRSPEGPLAAHLASFANFVGEQGYSAFSLKRHVRIAVGFSRWLGHESTTTTHRYVEADLAMKEKALARLEAPETQMPRYQAPDSLMRFLKTL